MFAYCSHYNVPLQFKMLSELDFGLELDCIISLLSYIKIKLLLKVRYQTVLCLSNMDLILLH